MSLAHTYEQRQQMHAKVETVMRHRSTPVKVMTHTIHAAQEPALAPAPNTTTNLPKTHHFRYLMSEEMEERKAKGLCFNYEEKFPCNHQCKRLFRLVLNFRRAAVTMARIWRKMS